MRALLLAAGFGTRLRPITDHLPKCLVPVHGRPLLTYWLEMLLDNGVERIVLNTHYRAEQVRTFVAQSPWATRVQLVHEPQLLGTGGTVLACRRHFAEDPFLVAHADNLCRFDVRGFIAAHAARPPDTELTMMTFVTDTPHSCGIVQTDTQGRVTGFFEKVADPPGNLANAAVYILQPTVVDFLASLGRPVLDLSTEVIPHFVGRIATWPLDGYLRDIGTPQALEQAHLEFPPPGG